MQKNASTPEKENSRGTKLKKIFLTRKPFPFSVETASHPKQKPKTPTVQSSLLSLHTKPTESQHRKTKNSKQTRTNTTTIHQSKEKTKTPETQNKRKNGKKSHQNLSTNQPNSDRRIRDSRNRCHLIDHWIPKKKETNLRRKKSQIAVKGKIEKRESLRFPRNLSFSLKSNVTDSQHITSTKRVFFLGEVAFEVEIEFRGMQGFLVFSDLPCL